ncbi:MAG TPA: DUF4296 domain-containing protein [Prolixibacteraceae bacterium]|nr:DUF4296 domain-containing protein [Prolixibacteraceae bacterium]
MKQKSGIVLFLFFTLGLTGCFNASIPKPDELIPRDKFIDIMVDVYMIQGLQNVSMEIKELKDVSQTDFYHSVLKKHSVADTVFVRSLIYYSSYPKDYEKMHVQILDILNESELQFKPQQKLNLETQ